MLVFSENLIVVNVVNLLARMIGPVFGGIVFGFYVLYLIIICFLLVINAQLVFS